MASLDTDIRYISGVGEARARLFNKLGVFTLSDLLHYFPRAYEDRSHIKKISELIFGENVCVRAMVASVPKLQRIRKGLDIVKVRVVDSESSMNITFFNQSYIKDVLTAGEEYVFYGRVLGRIGQPEMTNPIFEKEETQGNVTGRIMPVYRLTNGLSQKMIAKSVEQGLIECGNILPDSLPMSVQSEYHLARAGFAYENIHFPQSYENLEIARRRLIFEELFILSCALQMLKDKRDVKCGYVMQDNSIEDFYASLKFSPTNAQKRAVSEAINDMRSGFPMSRLLQGDVGSGKTLVAAALCYYVYKSGFQSALMVPTEILAEQHFETLKGMLSPLGVNVDILTGGLTAKAKREALRKLISGETNLIIGTHSLISEDVEYKSLGLVVADEQHRFGVMQRAALTEKGDSPHVLVMSATPIPRTLALIVYNDLNVSVLDELPPGRQKVDTFSVTEDMRPRINNFIRKLVSEGRQVFIVCPAVEEREDGSEDLKSVKQYAENLKHIVFPDLKVELVHGKMRPKDKNEVMEAFSKGETDILIATTVIEVGVDVPNAALIVVENADRFGLSQLHQLRGRVGRGHHKSYCVLFRTSNGDTARERLQAMCDTNDGFKIAEEDLRIRGPGDFFGERQSGLPEMKIANFASDINILKDAQTAAQRLMKNDPLLTTDENHKLKCKVLDIIAKNSSTFN